jgi:hypothetical protein
MECSKDLLEVRAYAEYIAGYTRAHIKDRIASKADVIHKTNVDVAMHDTAPTNNNSTSILEEEKNFAVFLKSLYSEFKNQKTSPPKPNDDFKTTNVNQLKLALPDLEKSSPNPATPHDFITNYGVQTIACRFYKNDIFNDLCEDIFAEHQSAFVPLGYVLNYIKRQKEDPRPKKLKYGANIIHE